MSNELKLVFLKARSGRWRREPRAGKGVHQFPTTDHHRLGLSGASLSLPSSWWAEQGAGGHMLGALRSDSAISSLDLEPLRGQWIIFLFNFIKKLIGRVCH